MAEFKGTNEDWRLTNDFSEVTTSRVGILEGSKSICAINQYGKPREEIEANAKIIASAPELFEVVRELHKLLCEHEPNWYLKYHYNIAQKVIKKATE